MIKFGFVLVLFVLWFFATMLKINNKESSGAEFIARSIFFWVAIGIAFALGQMNA